jgi:hypothetical integral membrane protein (TIGR02206 family)
MKFQLFTNEHFFIIGLTIFLSLFFVWVGRKYDKSREILRWFFGILLLTNMIVYQFDRFQLGYWNSNEDLPLDLCDLANILTAFALLLKRRGMAEIAWCWVMTGTLNGLITPDFNGVFPQVPYMSFFIGHAGLIIATSFLVFGMKLHPIKGAWLRVVLASQVYFAVAFSVNKIIGSNYGYLMHKPEGGSAMDFFGPYPYYLITLECLGALLFFLVLLPFRKMRHSN